MDTNTKEIVKQVQSSSLFVVAALSPSFLISIICVFIYLTTQFPEIKEPISNVIASLLSKAGINVNKDGIDPES
jgi:hypothetical protein